MAVALDTDGSQVRGPVRAATRNGNDVIHFLGYEQADVTSAAVEIPTSPDLFKRGGPKHTGYLGPAPLGADSSVLWMCQCPSLTASNTGRRVIRLGIVPGVLGFPAATVLGHEVRMIGAKLTEAFPFPYGVFTRHRSIIAEGSWAKKVVVEPDTRDDD